MHKAAKTDFLRGLQSQKSLDKEERQKMVNEKKSELKIKSAKTFNSIFELKLAK